MLEVHFTVTLYCRLKSLQVVKLIWGSQLCQLCLVWVCVFYHTSMQDLQRWYFVVVKLDKEVQHATIELKASCLARERCLMPNSISPCLSARMKMLLTGCRDVSRCCWWCNIISTQIQHVQAHTAPLPSWSFFIFRVMWERLWNARLHFIWAFHCCSLIDGQTFKNQSQSVLSKFKM